MAASRMSWLRPHWRIQTLFTAVIVLLVLTAVVTITAFEVTRQQARFQNELEAKGRLLISALDDALADALYFNDVERARQLSDIVVALDEVESYRLFSFDGRILISSDAEKFSHGTIDRATLELVRSTTGVTIRRHGGLEAIAPIRAGSRVLGGVVVSLDLDGMAPAIRQMVVRHVQWGLVAALVGVVLAWLLARWMTVPVRHLIEAAQRVASGDLSVSAWTGRRDELGELGVAFEEMVRRLERRAERQAQAYTEQLEKANELLHQHAMEDALTRLPNRRLLLDRLAVATAEADRRKDHVGIIFLDVDHFKLINDSLGHTVGDDLLQQVARRLQEATRATDTVARLGGDEFTVVATHLENPEAAIRVAESVLEAVRAPFLVGDRQLQVTASVGVSVYPDDGEDYEALLGNADIAMYRAKELGRNRTQPYAQQMGELARERLDLERGLVKAIEAGELTSYYQPIRNLADGSICGVEALLRWEHPELGVLPAARFLPLVEQIGRLEQLDEQTLAAGVAHVQQWNQRFGLRLRLSVNLTARHFARGDFLDGVRQALSGSGMAPGRLELEITETAAMGDDPAHLGTLEALAGMGVSIAVDDFGTGYSSLSYLRALPVQRLKIDRQFVRELPHGQESAEIVKAVVSLAHSLGFKVTAEGVETSGQWTYLEGIGCDEAQGDLFEPALPAAAIVALLEEPRRRPSGVAVSRGWPPRSRGDLSGGPGGRAGSG